MSKSIHFIGANIRRMLIATVAVALGIGALSGCSRHFDAAGSAKGTDDSSQHGLSDARYKQAQGYSLLYADAKDVTTFKLEMKLKDKSDQVASLMNDFMDYDDHLMDQLKQLSKNYPGVRIDLPARSDIEEKERFAIGKDYLLDFIPLIGESGPTFERKALLFFLVFVDEQRHLVDVMADQETDPKLKSFLQQQHQTLDTLYKRYDSTLNQTFFTHPGSTG